MLKLAAAIALGLLLAAPAAAESSLNAYDAAHQALVSIFEDLPLSVRNVTLTEAPATGYGNYTPRDSAEFKPGEKIHVYVEVLGYGWHDNGDGTQSELLDADLNLLNATGQTVASQAKFLSANIKSRQHLLETFLTLDATLTSFQPGDYKLQYVLHDRAAGKDVSFEVPITLLPGEAAPGAASAAPGASPPVPPAGGSSAAQ